MLGAGRLPLGRSGVVELVEVVLALASGDDLLVERTGSALPRALPQRAGNEPIVAELGR